MRVRQDQLDFLRGIAATYVVINHVRGWFFVGGQRLLAEDPSPLNYLSVALLQLTVLGTEMVILFFVLSGFAMAHSVSRSSSVSRFYAKRIIRIWPPYIAATLLAFAVGWLVGIRVDVVQVATYLNPTTLAAPQFWSLPYEVVFYALCPLVAGKRYRWFTVAAVIGTMVTVALKGIGLNPWPWFFANFVGNAMLFFAAGILAYYHFDRIPKVRRIGWWLLGAFVLILTSRLAIGQSNLLTNLVVIAATLLTLKNFPDRYPAWANLGSFSYSIYIFHFALLLLVGWAVSQFGINPREIAHPFVWILVLPPVLFGCWLLYLVTERPCNRLLERMRSDKGQRAPNEDKRKDAHAADGERHVLVHEQGS